jgi:endo-1,4-beta-xylanase
MLNHSYRVDPALRHRIADVALTVTGPDGRPLPAGTALTVRQTRHRFGFGCIGFDFVPTDPPVRAGTLDDLWFDLFNTATLPFYWGEFEAERGRPRTEPLLAAARLLADRGVVIKGHPLTWHTVTAPWLLDLSVDEIERAQRERIRREVSTFAGLIDTWDAINEVVIMPVFDKEENGITRLARERGRIAVTRMAFEEARAANPGARLLLNDFDLSTAYECLIEGLLEAGLRIDALGLQSHMHQGYWGEERTLATLERFARYGLPLHLTENTLLSGDLMPAEIEDLNDHQVASWPSTPEGEARQADEVVRHYRTLLSHPAVESITWWGLSDAGAWLGAPGGLVRADGTPKPSYHALRSLVKDEWWLAPTEVTTDAAGRVSVSGFLGDYEVSGPGGTAGFSLGTPDQGVVSVMIPAAPKMRG